MDRGSCWNHGPGTGVESGRPCQVELEVRRASTGGAAPDNTPRGAQL